ncbi:MAG: hypothetical protein ACM3QZ_12895 [Solirubrobacterales bacterium]
MRSRLAVSLLVLVLLTAAAGCGQKANPNSGNPPSAQNAGPGTVIARSGNIKETANMRVRSPYSVDPGKVDSVSITAAEDYIQKNKEWNNRLLSLKNDLDKAYAEWSNKKISEVQFRENAAVIAKQMQLLNNETEFIYSINLPPADAERINAKLITRTYLLSSKALWDYLYDLANDQIPESQFSSEYAQTINGAFEPREQELARFLEQAR